MNNTLKELIRISRTTGKDPMLVQGGSGNTSVKTDDGKYMYIKASGTALKDMSEKAGWCRLRLDKVIEEEKGAGDVRPSIESPLHAILGKCVIHLHPVVTGAFVSAKNGQGEVEKLFKDEKRPATWVPFTNSGIALAKRIAKQVEDYQNKYGSKPTIIFLQKHGLFISADNPDTALRLLNRVIKRCSAKTNFPRLGGMKPINNEIIGEAKVVIRRSFYEATGRYVAVSYLCDREIAGFCEQKGAAKMLGPGAMTPNELVYTNGPAMWIEKLDSKVLTRQIRKANRPPAAFLVKNAGLFVAGEGKITDTVLETVKSSLIIRSNAFKMGGIVSLTKREQEFISRCEAEAVKSKESVGPLQGRIAVVTGAGSGLGKSIAIGLAKAGAMVAFVDIDKKAVEETIEEIRNAQAIAIECDVTSEASVDNVFKTVLEEWGGLDILVNAAGIAPPYGLVDMPADKWRMALDVNLTGYFLMARAAARLMIRQGMGGSIINLSSKSGLEASKNNTAYTTTKAGELAMARGWALELGEYGIRVNCVAPGNVFEGSKIWNPAYIKECAKKYGIRPEDVIAYYVNKTALRREIKGQDIADAVVFLCSDKARTITGQTLVADSGQVMVR